MVEGVMDREHGDWSGAFAENWWLSPGGLMRCCTQSFASACNEAVNNGLPEPDVGHRIKCEHCPDTWIVRGEDGVWKWDRPRT
jgi:hypothetical protein